MSPLPRQCRRPLFSQFIIMVLEHLRCVFSEPIYDYGVRAEVLYVCLHARSQIIILELAISNKKLVFSDKSSAKAFSFTPLHASTDPPRQRRYGLVVAFSRKLRNLHLNLCRGVPYFSFCSMRSTKSNK